MVESHTRFNFRGIDKFIVPVLLRKTYIERFIKSKHPDERKLIPQNSLPVPVLMVQKAGREAKTDKFNPHQEDEKDSALLVTPTRWEPKQATATRQLALRATYKIQVWVFTQLTTQLEVLTHQDLSKIMHLRRLKVSWSLIRASLLTPHRNFGQSWCSPLEATDSCFSHECATRDNLRWRRPFNVPF